MWVLSIGSDLTTYEAGKTQEGGELNCVLKVKTFLLLKAKFAAD
jgi:hypothetical protein